MAQGPVKVAVCPYWTVLDGLERRALLPDLRRRRDRRHPLVRILALAVSAVLAGARSMTAIAEWSADPPVDVLTALGLTPHPLTGLIQVPGQATVRRVLAAVDADVLDATVAGWVDSLRATETPPVYPRKPPPTVHNQRQVTTADTTRLRRSTPTIDDQRQTPSDYGR